MSCLKSAVNIRMKTVMSSNHNADPVSIGYLRNLREQSELLENSHMFMKKIKGTVAYFKNMLYDLLAMFVWDHQLYLLPFLLMTCIGLNLE